MWQGKTTWLLQPGDTIHLLTALKRGSLEKMK